jgi:alpha-tubulin suppressor-like RCC1 family protein
MASAASDDAGSKAGAGGDARGGVAADPGEAPVGRRLLAAAGRTTCVVRDRRVWCFGDPFGASTYGHNEGASPVPRAVPRIDDAVSIVMSPTLACVLREGGAVSCWGIVDDGTMGANVVRKRPVYEPRQLQEPEAVAALAAIAIDVGSTFGCAIRPQRDVACWGTNDSFQLGRAGKGSLVPAPVPRVTDAVELRTSSSGACARVRSGEVWCWGSGTTPKEGEPHVVPGLAGASALVVDDRRVCAIRGAHLVCVGGAQRPEINEQRLDGEPAEVAFGNGERCDRRRDGSVVCSEAKGDLSAVREAVEIAMGSGHACARERSGVVRCWGANEAGQAGQPARVKVAAPSPVRGITDATRIAMARGAGCAIRRDGRIACWGHGALGALGAGTGAPDRPAAADVTGVEPSIAIAGGGSHFCAIERKGTVRCWGSGGRRRVCEAGDEECAKVGAIPNLADAVDLSAFRDATCAVRRTGAVVCWGSEHDVGEQTPDPPKGTPTPVVGVTDAARVFVGYRRACAVRRDGRVACWGDDPSFALGQRPNAKERVVEIDGVADAVEIGRGQPDHVLTRGGEVRGFDWGNSFLKTPPDKPLKIAPPVSTLLTGIAQIAQDFYRACARARSGVVSCWDATAKVAPTGVLDAIDLDLSESGASCAVRRSGEVVCWGENEHGESGVEATSLVLIPSVVRGVP